LGNLVPEEDMKKKQDWKFPRLVTSLPGPKAKKLVGLDKKFVSPSYTRSYPLVAKIGRGAVVEDMDGNHFLDFAAGIAVVATGHCHPHVVAAIQKQAAELIHMSGTDFYYPNMVELAAKLASIAPGKDAKRVYFGNSGTEAIEAAMKLARYHTRRDKFIAFFGCFHGRTFGSLSLTASKSVQRKSFGPLLPGVVHIPYPDPYHCSLGHKSDVCGSEIIEFLQDQVFHRLVDPADVAAIFIEPIQGEGGYVPAPAPFLLQLQSICRRNGILLVADEVQCGMGRTGKWWASAYSGIEPDIVCVAKGIASGMPLSATIARASIMDWTPGAHASTFGGNPVCVAASLATIDLVERKYMGNAKQVGDYMLRRMEAWPDRYSIVGDVRGRGLMIGVEIVRDQGTKQRAPVLRNKIIEKAFHKGLLILGAGDNTVRLAPPLVIDEEQAEYALRVLGECIAEVQRSR
jgi:4-aminobutyrate aminotransferase